MFPEKKKNMREQHVAQKAFGLEKETTQRSVQGLTKEETEYLYEDTTPQVLLDQDSGGIHNRQSFSEKEPNKSCKRLKDHVLEPR